MLAKQKQVGELWDQYNDLYVGSGFSKRSATDLELVKKRAPILKELSKLDLSSYPDEVFQGLFTLLISLLKSIKIEPSQDFDKDHALLFFNVFSLLSKLVAFAARPDSIQVSPAIETLISVLLKIGADDSLLEQTSGNKRAVLTAVITAFGTLSKTPGIMSAEEVGKISEALKELQKKIPQEKFLKALTGALTNTLADLQRYVPPIFTSLQTLAEGKKKWEETEKEGFFSIGALPGEPVSSASVLQSAVPLQTSQFERMLGKGSLVSGIVLGVFVALVVAAHFIPFLAPFSLIGFMLTAGYSATTVGIIFGLLAVASAGLITVGKMFSSDSTSKGIKQQELVEISSRILREIRTAKDQRYNLSKKLGSSVRPEEEGSPPTLGSPEEK